MLLLPLIWFNLCTTLYAQQRNETGDDLTSRILYGERANIKEYPFFAALINQEKELPYCGAAILSDRWLVTAGHCLPDSTIKITGKGVSVGGDSFQTSQLYTFDKVVIYPQYLYDQAILEMPRYDIALLRLSRPLVFSTTVKPIKLPKQQFTRNAFDTFVGHGTDEGDSGSPLVQGNTIVGVASFILNGDCSENRLTVFTDVAPFVPWIKSVTGIQ